ncbi:thiamine pyrophosphate-dependent dehydrogenase E1 component subunit alpha [Christensenella hongkongensis]|nr:thiamine pyrophosphate-dependent dehydrogenase E1 component subunit alpha [Christensenella hongkongensis]
MDKKTKDFVKKALPALTDLKAPEGFSLEEQKKMFRTMCLIREFDTQVRTLWMKNEIYGLAHSYVGAEAIAVGACANLSKEDFITSTHRGHGHTIAKGGDVRAMMAELHGKYEGLNRGKGGSMHIADVDIGMLGATGIVGSGMPIALGSAISANVLKNGRVTICFHGDGGTNQGVWHESLNMAAAWNLPAIFLIENNQYAIATEIGWVAKETDLYKRAVGYGIEGVQIDGFNVFEVYKAVKKAVEKAKNGGGPTLIEARFIRLLGHFVADDQWYRDLDAAQVFWEYEPVKRMREYFIAEGLLTEKQVDEIQQSAIDEIADAINYAQNECTEPPADTLYDDIYADGEIIY